jgi:hypothetical protein
MIDVRLLKSPMLRDSIFSGVAICAVERIPIKPCEVGEESDHRAARN